MKTADILQAIFEAMPMAILVFIKTENWGPSAIITFVSSVISIMIYCVNLVVSMYNSIKFYF